MKATNEAARENVAEVVAWLYEEFGYEEDDLPTGKVGSFNSCPIACAIGGITGKVVVGSTNIVINGTVVYNSYVSCFPSVPAHVEEFIFSFDHQLNGYKKYVGECK